MSTTFAVKTEDGEEVPVARQVGIGNGKSAIYWKNPLALSLPDNTEVVAIDNDPHGIFTIGDLKSKGAQ